MASAFSPQLKRLLGYVRPYALRLGVGIVLLAIVAIAEGLVALMIKPAVDYVLDPSVVGSALPLGKIPFTDHVVYLNTFLPSSFHNVKTIFFFTLLMIFGIKAIAEYLGSTQIQYVGHAAVTNLRNDVYAKIISSPSVSFRTIRRGVCSPSQSTMLNARASRFPNTSPICFAKGLRSSYLSPWLSA